jgi:hypothetical protein
MESGKMEKAIAANRSGRPIGLWKFEDPALYRYSALRWRSGCQPHSQPTLSFPEVF